MKKELLRRCFCCAQPPVQQLTEICYKVRYVVRIRCLRFLVLVDPYHTVLQALEREALDFSTLPTIYPTACFTVVNLLLVWCQEEAASPAAWYLIIMTVSPLHINIKLQELSAHTFQSPAAPLPCNTWNHQ